jgi:hypothetical protein
MKRSTPVAIAALGIAAVLGLAGCSSDESGPQLPMLPSLPDLNLPEGEPSALPGGGTSVIDPAYPWPASLPRPQGVQIVNEFSGPNVLGEGGTWSLEFTAPSVEYVQEWIHELSEAGVVFMLGGELMRSDNEYSVAAMSEGYMASVSVDADTLLTTFSFLGVAP